MQKGQQRALVAAAGVIAHLLVFFLLVTRDERTDSLYCIESSCWSLVAIDFPVSLVFLGGDHTTVTWGSATVGSLWWGTLAAGLHAVVSRRRDSTSAHDT